MKIIFTFLIVLFIGLSIRFRRFRNPYRLTMIFGKKGSGKSSYLVKLAVHYHKHGFHIYSNMLDCSLPYVIKFDPYLLGKFVPLPNSVLLIDEAGTVYDNRKFKSFSDEARDFFKLQRHYKCIVFLASQSYDVDKKLRDLTDDMLLCTGFLPWLALRRPIKRTITLTEASSFGESRIADNLKFRWLFAWRFTFLPKYSKYFDSFKAPERPTFEQ